LDRSIPKPVVGAAVDDFFAAVAAGFFFFFGAASADDEGIEKLAKLKQTEQMRGKNELEI
jgi:hypothetical protein